MKKKYVITLVLMISLLFILFVIQLNEPKLPKLQLSPSIEVARIITLTGSVVPFVMGVLIVGITGTLILNKY